MAFGLMRSALGPVSLSTLSHSAVGDVNISQVWTPLIPSTMDHDAQDGFSGTPMGRPGQPSEVATCFVFLASQDSSFISGQCLHPNGGVIVNG